LTSNNIHPGPRLCGGGCVKHRSAANVGSQARIGAAMVPRCGCPRMRVSGCPTRLFALIGAVTGSIGGAAFVGARSTPT